MTVTALHKINLQMNPIKTKIPSFYIDPFDEIVLITPNGCGHTLTTY